MVSTDRAALSPAQTAARDALGRELEALFRDNDLERVVAILRSVNDALALERATTEPITVH